MRNAPQPPSPRDEAAKDSLRKASLSEGGGCQRQPVGAVPVHDPPSIVCCDLWPRGTLTQAKMDAYKRLADLGDIRIRRVTFHKGSGYTTVDYWSNLPHAWTLNRLRELAGLLDQGTQTQMEVS